MHSAPLAAAVGIFALTAYLDVRTRRIPNVLSMAIAVLGVVRIALGLDWVGGIYSLASGAAMFATAFALYRWGLIGGGDAKMVAAAALLIGYRDLLGFLFIMSICGGALAVATLVADKLELPLRRLWRAVRMRPGTESEPDRRAPRQSSVPYGVAIAAAGVVTLISPR
jgi:prepilin peptidase CpaA